MTRWLLTLSLLLGLCLSTWAQQPDTRAHAGSMRYNKLRIGTLTSCAPGLFVTGFDPQTSKPLCASITLPALDPTVMTTTGTQKVTNKQNVARVVPYTPSGSPLSVQVNCDSTDIATIDALAGDLTMAIPLCTGTNPEPEQELEVRFRSAAPRAITWHPAFCEDNGVPLFTSTTGNGTTFDRIKFRRNSVSACWGVISTTRGVGRGVTALASSATFTCQVDIAAACEMQATMAAGTITIAAPTGTPQNGQQVMLRLLCTNLQTVVMTTGAGGFVASPNVPLLTSCPAGTSAWTAAGAIFSSVLNRWQIYATN